MKNRKPEMTDRERILALLSRRKPDRVPIWPFAAVGFSLVYTSTPISDACNNPLLSYEPQKKTARDFGWVFTPRLVYGGYGGWEFGGKVQWPDSGFSHTPTLVKHPVETEEGVTSLRAPDVRTAGWIPTMVEFYKRSSLEMLDNEPFNVTVFGANRSFTTAVKMAGPDRLFEWIREKPDVAHRVLRLANEHIVGVAGYWKSLFGTDGVLPFGGEPASANPAISPELFGKYVSPYLQEVNESLLGLGYRHLYAHICGEHNGNLPYWAEIPMGDPGFVSLGHEIELGKAAEYFPHEIVVGNLNPAVLQTGTPETVYEETRRTVEEGKKIKGGYVFSPGCELPPGSPVDNVRAMTQAVLDYGWYG